MDIINKYNLIISELNNLNLNNVFLSLIEENNELKISNKLLLDENTNYKNINDNITNENKKLQDEISNFNKVSVLQSVNKQLNDKINYINILEKQLLFYKNKSNINNSPIADITLTNHEQLEHNENNKSIINNSPISLTIQEPLEHNENNKSNINNSPIALTIQEQLEHNENNKSNINNLPITLTIQEPLEHNIKKINIKNTKKFQIIEHDNIKYYKEIKTNLVYNNLSVLVGKVKSSGKIKFKDII